LAELNTELSVPDRLEGMAWRKHGEQRADREIGKEEKRDTHIADGRQCKSREHGVRDQARKSRGRGDKQAHRMFGIGDEREGSTGGAA
jgi:hypothetical protein